MELEIMHNNVDALWVKKEKRFPAANNPLNISGR
jgi:hypothetical protein